MGWRRRELDPTERVTLLLRLRQQLMYERLEALHLKNLEPLRTEVEFEYQKIVKGKG